MAGRSGAQATTRFARSGAPAKTQRRRAFQRLYRNRIESGAQCLGVERSLVKRLHQHHPEKRLQRIRNVLFLQPLGDEHVEHEKRTIQLHQWRRVARDFNEASRHAGHQAVARTV